MITSPESSMVRAFLNLKLKKATEKIICEILSNGIILFPTN